MFGQWLNQDRARARNIRDNAQAFAMALGGQPDPDFYRAIAADDKDAERLASEARHREKEARTASRLGFQ